MPTENNDIAAAMTDARRCEGHSTAIDSSTAEAATLTRRITVSMFVGTLKPQKSPHASAWEVLATLPRKLKNERLSASSSPVSGDSMKAQQVCAAAPRLMIPFVANTAI